MGSAQSTLMGRGHHKMATVSRLTGFKPELLRAWETRHRLLAPARGPGGQRLYSDQDLAILHGVRSLLAEGRSISEIAAIGRRQLIELSKSSLSASADRAGAHAARGARGRSPPARPPPSGSAAPAPTVAPRAPCRSRPRRSAACRRASIRRSCCSWWPRRSPSIFRRRWRASGSPSPTARSSLLRASAGLSRQTSTSSRSRIDLRTYRFKVGVVARSGSPFVSNRICRRRGFRSALGAQGAAGVGRGPAAHRR